jgi:hypothetical protein
MTLSWVHSISQLPKRSRNRTTLQICTTLQDKSIRNGKKGRGAYGGDVSRSTSRPAQAVTVSSLWCDGQIPTGHRTCSYRYRVTNFWYVTWSCVPSTPSRHGVTVLGNVTRAYPPLSFTIGQFKPRSNSPCEQFLSHDFWLLTFAACIIVLWNNNRTEIFITVVLQTKLCHQIPHKLEKQTQYFGKSMCRNAGTNVWHSVTTFLDLYHTKFCQLHLNAFVASS